MPITSITNTPDINVTTNEAICVDIKNFHVLCSASRILDNEKMQDNINLIITGPTIFVKN